MALPTNTQSLNRRKACCHPFVAGDVFKFMSILIKLSNHLGLILPGVFYGLVCESGPRLI
jgi:hypothetical protein